MNLADVRLLIVTPVDGAPASATAAIGYQLAVARILAEHRDAALLSPMLGCHPSDLVRARSLAAQTAIDTDRTHVLWLDADVVPKPGFLSAMLATGADWIGCPYPKKKIHWDRVRPTREEQSENLAYNYAYHPSVPQNIEVRDGCIEVERLAIGCTLTSVDALRAMVVHYREIDWFVERTEDGRAVEAVAIFGLLFGAPRTIDGRRFRPLYGEDYSACERYQVVRETYPNLGLSPIRMLVTHPADHVGGHCYRGSAEGLVFAR
jgi:hypothetical protein